MQRESSPTARTTTSSSAIELPISTNLCVGKLRNNVSNVRTSFFMVFSALARLDTCSWPSVNELHHVAITMEGATYLANAPANRRRKATKTRKASKLTELVIKSVAERVVARVRAVATPNLAVPFRCVHALNAVNRRRSGSETRHSRRSHE